MRPKKHDGPRGSRHDARAARGGRGGAGGRARSPPGGFEELEVDGAFVLALYVDESDVEAIRRVFSDLSVDPVAPGWEDAWRAFHRPARVGGLWIGPPWEQPDGGERAVVIDPGRAFGTGAHPTTRLCVELLARSERGSLLDVGCGSGVLSIAAARLGFSPIRAVDNDPVAVETTIANAAVNGVVVEATVLDGELDELPGRGSGRGERPARSGGANPRSARRTGCDHVRLSRDGRPSGHGLDICRPDRARRVGRRQVRSGAVDLIPREGGRARHAQPFSSAERGTIGSSIRIVPPRRMSARRPPRCTRPLSTPEGARRCRWAQGSASRRPAHSTSPTRKR